jgi:8-oxo-dGTP pyrophosphatase MutT (NUDIX family)
VLDFDPTRPPTAPRPAATTLVLRRGPRAVEVLGILRHPKSSFLGGVLAFPGGKVDEQDRDERWASSGLPTHGERLAAPESPRALAVAACRELLEEVAILPVEGLRHGDVLALRDQLLRGASFAQVIDGLARPLILQKFHTFGRWVTPEAEARRYDAAFFLLELPEGQEGSSDQHETTAALWDSAAGFLERWGRGEVQMAPPTTRMLELLAGCDSVEGALALAARQGLGPVCPRFVADEGGGYLALPGDPSHEVSERRVDGATRFVLRDGRFVSA